MRLPATIADGGEFIADARALDAAGADIIWIEDGAADAWVVLGALSTVTHRARLGFAHADVAGDTSRVATLQVLSRGRFVASEPPDERWKWIELPATREAWAATMREHEAAGTTGIVVPWDARLIDLLRNPEPDDRSDLLMSTG